ncbi:MAG: DUF881 domain-containing protein [Chloroflexi bacterium]|nr:MAG: DUF881 domain-containing protein [Chloroflexota bacterium]
MPSRPSLNAVVVGLLSALLAFVAVVQVRSQFEVERSLSGVDPTTLAFLIDDLHRANDTLARDAGALAARRAALQGGSNQEAAAQLNAEAAQLRVVEGLVPVHGPGVVVTVDAPLTPLDLQDALDNLRVAGAEALALNDQRLVTSSVINGDSEGVTVDGVSVRGPWTLWAIGDPTRLSSAADQMTRALRDDPRVHSAGYRAESDLVIRSTVVQRPFVYGSA